MTYHLVAYERGRDQAGSDFAITLSGILYLGWIGAYLISLRQLPEGEWWLLVILPAVWLADMGAYFVGSRFGKHKLSPQAEPEEDLGGLPGGHPCGHHWHGAAGSPVSDLDRSWFSHYTAAGRAGGAGDGRPDHPGRPGGEHDQAPGGGEGFGEPATRARRRFRPHRLLAVGWSDRVLPGGLAVRIKPLGSGYTSGNATITIQIRN